MQHVDQDERINGLDMRTDEAIVEDTETGHKTSIPWSSVGRHDWATLRAVATGERDAGILTHMTRVVGYYARVQNMNRSKARGEIPDRRRGNYAVT
jgi:hypothetical protein